MAFSYSNNNLGNGTFKALIFSDFSASDDIKTVCQKMFSALPESGICYRVRMKPAPSGTTADAYVYCASSGYGFVHIRDHRGTDYYGRVQNGVWSWDAYALKSDFACGESKIRMNTGATNVTFPQAFDNIPVVVAVPKGSSKEVMLLVKVENITKSGFMVTTVAFEDGSPATPSYDVTVEWIAMRKA